jgi:hypothetical protein
MSEWGLFGAGFVAIIRLPSINQFVIVAEDAISSWVVFSISALRQELAFLKMSF